MLGAHEIRGMSPDYNILLASYPFNLERKKYTYLFPMKPDEKSGFRAKNSFWWPFWNFLKKTGSRFLGPFDFTIHYHRTWMFTIRVLKISQSNLDLLTKNRFPVAILYFYDLTGSIFFLIIDLQITTIKPENFPFEFWKYRN